MVRSGDFMHSHRMQINSMSGNMQGVYDWLHLSPGTTKEWCLVVWLWGRPCDAWVTLLDGQVAWGDVAMLVTDRLKVAAGVGHVFLLFLHKLAISQGRGNRCSGDNTSEKRRRWREEVFLVGSNKAGNAVWLLCILCRCATWAVMIAWSYLLA